MFTFAVPRKQSHYVVNYCCFPTSENTGGMGSYTIATSFEPFHATPGYHGELFVEPESGTIVRLITEAEMKPADFVQQEDTRIDYGTMPVADKQYIVALRSMLLTTVVPAGESFQKFSKRRTLFEMQYGNYQIRAESHARP